MISCWSKGIVLIQSSSHIPLVTIYFVLSRSPILWDRQGDGQAMQLQIAIQQAAHEVVTAQDLPRDFPKWKNVSAKMWQLKLETCSPVTITPFTAH